MGFALFDGPTRSAFVRVRDVNDQLAERHLRQRVS